MFQRVVSYFGERFYPGYGDLSSVDRFQAHLMIILSLNLLPVTIVGLVWLVLRTDLPLSAPWPMWGLFFVLTLLIYWIDDHPFTLLLELDAATFVPLETSFADVLWMSTFFVFGPLAIWMPIASTVIDMVFQLPRVARQSVSPFWFGMSQFGQGGGVSAFVGVLLVVVYQALGGTFPLAPISLASMFPAAVAILIPLLLPRIILLPTILTIQQLSGGQQDPFKIMGGTLVFTLATVLAALFGALIYTRAGWWMYLVFISAIVMVSWLAFSLSESHARQTQRAREMTHLEALGEAIIQSPADASTLQDLLYEHVHAMFPLEQVVIRLTDVPAAAALEPFDLSIGDGESVASADLWQQVLSGESAVVHHRRPRSVTYPRGTVILVPIPAVDDSIAGAVGLLRARRQGKAVESLASLQALTSQISSALGRAETYARDQAHQKAEQELAFAGHIQASFLPQTLPEIPGYELTATLDPARQTSGDFYDFIPLEDGSFGLVVADVADKGTGAALYMALARTLIRTAVMQYPAHLARALAYANQRLLSDTSSEQFVTLFLARLDPSTGLLCYANAGHNPAYLVHADKSTTALYKTGIPLGMFEDMEWKDAEITLRSGEALILYTDGVSEAQNPDGELFEDHRLLSVAVEQMACSSGVVHQAILEAVADFTAGADQSDDITLVTLVCADRSRPK